MTIPCPLCSTKNETTLWKDARCRVILIDEPDYAGYCRVIWNTHVREMTDLAPDDRAHIMKVVFAVETVLRELLKPDKINLASLGNQTPHVHWHVIPRYHDDAHFPNSVWSARLRSGAPRAAPELEALQRRLHERLG